MQTVSANIAVGSHVWVEDPEVAWLDGEVVEVNAEETKVNCTSGKTVSSSYTNPGLDYCNEVCHCLWFINFFV